MARERKSIILPPSLAIKAADGGAGTLEGYASTFGHVDAYGDTIEPGAYRADLAYFLKAGYLGVNHSWEAGLGIGTIDAAHEDGTGLFITASFFPDQASQDVRAKAAARLAAGKSVGLSIGYEPLEWAFRPVQAGETVPYGDQVRILKRIKLFETSIVNVPADQYAQATAAKADGLRLADHDDAARDAVLSLVRRYRQLVDADVKQGAAISAARRKRIEALRDSLAAAIDDLQGLLDETAPKEPDKAALVALHIQAMIEDARRLGVAV